jgi:AcrR family transcriptional regulator
MVRRKRLDTDERKSQLLKLGRSMFSASSYDEVSIDEVAQRAGISKGLLYHYFKSKRAFYTATVEAAASELMARAVPDPDIGALEQVEKGVRAYLNYVDENRDAYRSLLSGGIGNDRELHAIVDRVRQGMTAIVLARMRPGPGPAMRVAVRGWVGFVEATSLAWIETNEPTQDELAEMLVGLLVHLTATHS